MARVSHGSQREDRVRKLPLRHGVEHIALVLRLVERLLEEEFLPRPGDTRIVAGDDLFAAELLGAAEERIELHAPVALDAGVRRAGAAVSLAERQHDLLAEALGKIENAVAHPQPVGHGAGVLHIVERAAGVLLGYPGIGVCIELHGAADALVPLALREIRRDGGIDAAAHGNERLHALFSEASSMRTRIVPPQTMPSSAATSFVMSISMTQLSPVPMIFRARCIAAASLHPPPMVP